MDEKRKVSCIAPYKIKEGKVWIFLQKRSDSAERDPGLFGFFGGGSQEEETPEETMLRETKEELSYCPENFCHFGSYDLSKSILDLYTTMVDDSFESKIEVLEGDYGKWFCKDDYISQKDLISGNLEILEELYEKLKS